MGTIRDRLLGAVGRLAGDADGGEAGAEESCAFCGKAGDAVKHLIAGAQAMICDECVDGCIAVLAGKDAEWRAAARRALDEDRDG
jgi:hypothetical protein